MSDVQQFLSLRQLSIRFSIPSWPYLSNRHQRQAPCLLRHTPQFAYSLLLVLFSTAAHAQCPIQFEYPPTPSQAQASAVSDDSLQQDVRASIAAQKNGNCQSAKLFQKRTLSKEDLQELRRVVREHAKNKPMHGAVGTKP